MADADRDVGAEAETDAEVDAAVSVYGSDCTVLQRSPPHLLVRLKPRTADDISQQFVEAVLVMKATPQYPQKPPLLELKDTKGLEEKRESFLLSELQDLSNELSSNPMLVAVCEAALDRLTEMNQPDGDCCFCMFPLSMGYESSGLKPLMKLMSCFHCFHSDCFSTWFRWILLDRGLSCELMLDRNQDENIQRNLLEALQLNCPVCRKSVNAEDILSIHNTVTAHSLNEEVEEHQLGFDPEVMLNASELERRARFENIFAAQQQCGGIIEPKKLEVLVPGMFVALPAPQNHSHSSGSGAACASEEAPNTHEVVVELDNVALDSQNPPSQAGFEASSSVKNAFGNQPNSKPQRRGRQQGPRGGRPHWVKRTQEGAK